MSTVQIEGLWSFIQTLALSNRNKQWLADRLIESTSTSVSPSNDEWFDDANNVKMLQEAINESKCSPLKEYSLDSIDQMLGYGV